MVGQKRPREESDPPEVSIVETNTPASPFMPMFEAFKQELDDHHDRQERIIKASRDITALSKKTVHQLHGPIPPKVTEENIPRKKQINGLFTSATPDLQGINSWRYQQQVSPGVQEYIEAISMQHYLETQRLISAEEAQAKLPQGMELTTNDYLLGIYDLVGELMRFAITKMATDGALPRGSAGESGTSREGRDILMDLRQLRTSFESLNVSPHSSLARKGLDKKMETMRQSIEKVENSVYGMIIRGQERPKGWMPELKTEERPREVVEGY